MKKLGQHKFSNKGNVWCTALYNAIVCHVRRSASEVNDTSPIND